MRKKRRDRGSWTNSTTVSLGQGSRQTILAGALIACLSQLVGHAQAPPEAMLQRPERIGTFFEIPLQFKRIPGSSQNPERFVGRGRGYGVTLGPEGFAVTFAASRATEPGGASPPLHKIRARLSGSSAQLLKGSHSTGAVVNEFSGNRAEAWRTGIPTYESVTASSIYPGIDIVYYGNARRLEYDFIVSPLSDPRKIELSFEGVRNVEVDRNGDLILTTPDGIRLRQLKPTMYQVQDGHRIGVSGGYSVDEDGSVRFRVGDYERSRDLIIDPILVHGTYFGGSGVDSAAAVTEDMDGMIYLAGGTFSDDLLLQDPLQATRGGDEDAYLTKIDPSTNTVIFSTYIGGTSDDRGLLVRTDSGGNVYLSGTTRSFNFPTQDPALPALRGGVDVFLSKLSPDGSTLLRSTYLGGGQGETPTGLSVTPHGAVTIGGYTTSRDFPVASEIQTDLAGKDDFFVTQFRASGSISFSTYFGGGDIDRAHGMSVDSDGNILLAGETRSADFPLMDPFQDTLASTTDAAAVRIDPEAPALLYSTYLGGTADDRARSIGTDMERHIVVVGETASTDFPVVNALQSVNAGAEDLFVTRLTPSGNAAILSTYFGGSASDLAQEGVLESSQVYLAGTTESPDFPTRDPIQGNLAGGSDALLARIDLTRISVSFSTLLGGSGVDRARDLLRTTSGRLFLAGTTESSDFPVEADALDSTLSGASDGFLVEISETFSLNFAQFGNGGTGSSAIQSDIELVSKDAGRPTNARVIFRDDEGEPLTLDLNGQQVDGMVDVIVPAGGNVQLKTDGQGELVTGSVRVLSERPVAGFILYDAGDTGSTGVDSSRALTSMVAPVSIAEGSNTGLAFMGLGTGQELRLVLRDSGGVVQGQAGLQIGPNSHVALFVTEVDWTPAVDLDQFDGNVTVSGPFDFGATIILVQPGKFIILPVSAIE